MKGMQSVPVTKVEHPVSGFFSAGEAARVISGTVRVDVRPNAASPSVHQSASRGRRQNDKMTSLENGKELAHTTTGKSRRGAFRAAGALKWLIAADAIVETRCWWVGAGGDTEGDRGGLVFALGTTVCDRCRRCRSAGKHKSINTNLEAGIPLRWCRCDFSLLPAVRAHSIVRTNSLRMLS